MSVCLGLSRQVSERTAAQLENDFAGVLYHQKRHHSSDSATSGRDRSYSTDSADALPSRLKEEPWLLDLSGTFLQQYVQYLQSIGFILVQVRPQSPARRCVLVRAVGGKSWDPLFHRFNRHLGFRSKQIKW